MPDVWEKLIETYKPKSVLDVGCGYGHAVKWFNDRAILCNGIEGFSEAVENTAAPGRVWQWDFSRGRMFGPDLTPHDLCWCAEFVEHVEAKYIPNFLVEFNKCRVVAMTHAVPGQGGFHHVNEQPAEYWIGAMAAIGFHFDRENTMRIRRPAPYGVNNLLIFVRE